jgi:diguanylate cyclase (GGDEF)-like protein
VARLGGDEFSILLPETSATAAGVVLEKVQQHLRSKMAIEQWQISFSIGVATFLDPRSSVEAMLRTADGRC